MKKQITYALFFIATMGAQFATACNQKGKVPDFTKFFTMVKAQNEISAVEKKVKNLTLKLLTLAENPFGNNEKLREELHKKLSDQKELQQDLEKKYKTVFDTYEKKIRK